MNRTEKIEAAKLEWTVAEAAKKYIDHDTADTYESLKKAVLHLKAASWVTPPMSAADMDKQECVLQQAAYVEGYNAGFYDAQNNASIDTPEAEVARRFRLPKAVDPHGNEYTPGPEPKLTTADTRDPTCGTSPKPVEEPDIQWEIKTTTIDAWEERTDLGDRGWEPFAAMIHVNNNGVTVFWRRAVKRTEEKP